MFRRCTSGFNQGYLVITDIAAENIQNSGKLFVKPSMVMLATNMSWPVSYTARVHFVYYLYNLNIMNVLVPLTLSLTANII
jgi:hypothetical protein